jgi:putative membrane protein
VIEVRDLPALNAFLNATSAALLASGYRMIRAGRRETHRRLMLAAFATSTLFLISYLTYHFQVGSVRFQKTGWIRMLYFGVLVTHTVLAAAVPPLALVTLYRAAKGRFESHRRIARITLPVWLYVSVTGVVVYVMLYHL